MDDESGSAADADNGIFQREIDPNPETAEYALLEFIAEREGVAMDELPSLYDHVDHFVEALFEDPPAESAQMEIEFSYAGYRVTLSQEGHVTLVEVKKSMERDGE